MKRSTGKVYARFITFMPMRIFTVCLLLSLSLRCMANVQEISIMADSAVLNNSISGQAIADVQNLLHQVFGCKVTLNNSLSGIQLKLPVIDTARQNKPDRFSKNFDYPYYQYPDHDYRWISFQIHGQIILVLETPSFNGIQFALYGLLQEQLGVLFVHPKQTIIPHYDDWPLDPGLDWTAKAQFDKKGFHIHSQHPLELTEQLLDEEFPDALHDVEQYLDWLVHNGQNYFEFNLLESIDRKEWPAYAKTFVDYGKRRGIIMGIDISLHMIQQKAFMLYQTPPASFKKKAVQVKKNLAWLFQADWDIVNMEFSTTEYSEGDMEEKEKLRLMIIDLVKNTYHAKLMGREHVVKADEMTIASKNTGYQMIDAEKELDKNRGVLIHTVMFYTATEPHAPVYENQNLQHMMVMLEREIKQRETWYYPESAYWITFDASIPMFLLPYLSARLTDIDTMVAHGVPGHITFSSGWEWGYWLVDYSIARWSWQYTYKKGGENIPHTPTEYIQDIFQNENITQLFTDELDLQQHYLKDQNLMQYMSPANVSDELPGSLNMQFEPRPDWKYRYLRKKSGETLLQEVRQDGVDQLRIFGNKTMHLLDDHKAQVNLYLSETDDLHRTLLTELYNATRVVGYRALHKAGTLGYLISLREAELNHTSKKDSIELFNTAVAYRNEAQQLVNYAEQNLYRYPVELIARRHWSHTYCHFGYLYPVSNLHFWRREELQITHNRYGPFYKLIWNLPRTVGLIN